MRAEWTGTVRGGAGMASVAFQWAKGRRMDEIEAILEVRPYPGTLNVNLDRPFAWNTAQYIEGTILEAINRHRGLERVVPTGVRFYPVTVDGHGAWALRWADNSYSDRFLELVASVRLRDHLRTSTVTICA